MIPNSARLPLATACLMLVAAIPAHGQETGYVETVPGVSIYYEKYGSGEQAVMIPNRLFMPEMRILARPHRTLILYDMRNRGRSGRVEDVAKLTILGDVQDVEALREHFGFETVSLVGYSYLGLMVALYARDHPERVDRIVQIAPVPRKFGTAFPNDQTAGLSTLSAEGQAAAEAWQAAQDAAATASSQAELCRVQGRFLAYLLVGNPANHTGIPDVCVYENEHYVNQVRHLEAHFGDIQSRDFPKDAFTQLSLPVLTIHGTLDRNAPYGGGLEWATTFANGRLITVAGAAHQVWLDDPSVLEDINVFLDGTWPVRARGFGRQ